MKNIAIFASGSGTNAQNIIEYFKGKGKNPVKLILSNKADAFVLERAKLFNISSLVFNQNQFYNSLEIADVLEKSKIDFIVLAGFLWKIPEYLLKTYSKRIINIHPAILPEYGGKGMYGMHVHESVFANHAKETGITIHYLNEDYDKGEIIFQAKCKIEPFDTPETIARKVHELEYEYYPKIIEQLIDK